VRSPLLAKSLVRLRMARVPLSDHSGGGEAAEITKVTGELEIHVPSRARVPCARKDKLTQIVSREPKSEGCRQPSSLAGITSVWLIFENKDGWARRSATLGAWDSGLSIANIFGNGSS
jgi:hypothetical protein